MKKITNNSRWGLIAMLLNAVMLIFVIISVVKLNSYDKLNAELQSVKPLYTTMSDSIKRVERSVHVCSKKIESQKDVIAQLNEQLVPLNAEAKTFKKAVPDSLKNVIADKKAQIERNEATISEDSAMLVKIQDTLTAIQAQFVPIEKDYNAQFNQVVSPLKGLNAIVMVAVIFLILKLLAFAYWMYLNVNNVCAVAPWMKKSHNKPLWAILGWFVPLYNLLKPCSVYSEMLSETNYLLRDKSIVAETKDANHMESVGFWWGLYLFAKVIMPFIVGGAFICFNYWFLPAMAGANTAELNMGFLDRGTFFGINGLYCYVNHGLVITLFVIAWAAYLLYESYMILSYNKLNKLMVDNAAKFETTETPAEK